MTFTLRTRAATRALTVMVGSILGLAYGAACLAGGTAPERPAAQVYARAARQGYLAGSAKAPPRAPASAARSAPPAHKLTRAGPGTLDCLAAAVYYEARGEARAGRAAVAQVVLNRTRRPGYPKSVCAVVYQGVNQGDCQFSFACNGAMANRREPAAWVDARQIAERALRGYVMTAVGRATCFHAVNRATAEVAQGGVRLGRQVFFAAS